MKGGNARSFFWLASDTHVSDVVMVLE